MTSEHRTSSQSPNGDHASGPQYVHGSKTGGEFFLLPESLRNCTDLSNAESGGENKAGIVRGPPRKPRQSGKLFFVNRLKTPSDYYEAMLFGLVTCHPRRS